MITKDMFFEAIKVRDEASKKWGKACDFFFDEAQWYMESATLKALEKELEKLQRELDLLDAAVQHMRNQFTKEELKEMAKEYRGRK